MFSVCCEVTQSRTGALESEKPRLTSSTLRVQVWSPYCFAPQCTHRQNGDSNDNYCIRRWGLTARPGVSPSGLWVLL